LVGLTANTYNVTSSFSNTGFSILALYDEPMDENLTPALSFPVENPTALTYIGGSWLNSTTYQTNYSVPTSLTSLADIDVAVAGNATDAAGNPGTMTTYTNFFSINVIVNVQEVSSENPIVVYPNPVGTGNNLNIEMDHIPDNLSIDIYNSTGQLIQSFGEKDMAGNKVVVSTSNLSNGMYIVRVNSDEGRSVFNVSIAK
jgi:Secretion system C-terminal sorting domain